MYTCTFMQIALQNCLIGDLVYHVQIRHRCNTFHAFSAPMSNFTLTPINSFFNLGLSGPVGILQDC